MGRQNIKGEKEMRKVTVTDREGTIIFSLEDKYDNLYETALQQVFESFQSKDCKIEVDER